MQSPRSLLFVLSLVVVTALGGGLRAWNASTAVVHEDELHYASDGLWMRVLPSSSWATFLRDHPHPHLRLDATGARIAHWGEDGTRRLVGHPALYALVLGPVLAAARPQLVGDSVGPARAVSAAADTAVIPVLALAAAGLGFSPAVALVSALLYALSPAAATYGSLAYPDALLALFGSCLLLAATGKKLPACSATLGLVAALMAASKGTGLVAPVFALVLLAYRRVGWRGLLLFSTTFVVSLAALVSPSVYLAEVLDPLDAATRVRPNVAANLWDNLRTLVDFDHYYWLGFGQHGSPLAPALARAARVATPVYLALVPLGYFALARSKGLAAAAAAALPLVAVLAGVPASNGMWRFQIGMPLVCLVAAFAIAGASRRTKIAAAVLALVVAVQPLLPLRPGPVGDVALPSLLFANPAARQSTNLFNALKGRPFHAAVERDQPLTRRLWLSPGHYRVTWRQQGDLRVSLDGANLAGGEGPGAEVDVEGHVHTLELSAATSAKVFALAIAAGQSPPPPPVDTVVLISIDSLRADHLGVYGYAKPTSPGIDALARGGMAFDRAYSSTSWTLPSHVAMVTGLDDFAHGVTDDEKTISRNTLTIAEEAARAGVQTLGVYSGPYLEPEYGFGRGFDQYADCTSYGEVDTTWWKDLKRHREVHSDVTNPCIARVAKRWAEEARPGRRRFLFLHLWDVHYDYVPPKAYLDLFDPDYTGTLDPGGYAFNNAIRADMDPRDLQHVVARYDGEIRYTDDTIAGALDGLRKAGMLERAAVLVTADHGEEFFEHGFKGHRWGLFDEVLKVPLVMTLTSEKASAARSDRLVGLVDIKATVCELLGLACSNVDLSHSLLASYRGKAPSGPVPSVLAELTLGLRKVHQEALVRTQDKVIRPAVGGAYLYYRRDQLPVPGEKTPAFLVASSGFEGSGQEAGAAQELEARSKASHEEGARLREGEASQAPAIDDATRERLRSLGYLR